MLEAALYLIPVPLSEGELSAVLPARNIEIVREIKYFIVENVRTARRFLKKCDRNIDIDTLTFYELNRHTKPEDISGFLAPLMQGNAMGVISEAGCPAIADPGADVVAIAQRKSLRVVPLVGPSSILLAMMASGLNGQSFAFNGYLPVKPPERSKAIKALERRAHVEHQSQIFIEAPYRNVKLMEQMLQVCGAECRLTVACDITSPEEFIKTLSVAQWRKCGVPDIAKRPTIFIIG